MNKAIILFLYGTTLYITLSRWYKAGNSGMPNPKVIAPSTYLFGILALTSDFLEGLPVILAAALTFILWEQNKPQTATSAQKPLTKTQKATAAPAVSKATATVNQAAGGVNKFIGSV